MLQIKKILVGVIIAIFLAAGLLAAASFVVCKVGVLPQGGAAGTIAAAIGIIAAFVSAILTARWVGEKGLVHGALISIAFILLYAIGALVTDDMKNLTSIGIRAVLFLLSGMIGGIIGVGQKSGKVHF